MTEAMFEEIQNATTPQTIFGSDPNKAKKKFLYYSRRIHPDMVTKAQKQKAEQCFARLMFLWEQYTTGESSTTSKTNRITSKTHEYDLIDNLYTTSFSSVYRASCEDNNQVKIHITNSINDNDLAENAVKSLNKIKNVPEKYKMFFPQIIEGFPIRQSDGSHMVIVSKYIDGLVSLSDVKKAYPQGLNGRDLGWIFRRMLVTIGNTRDQGLSHGAITPDNVFVHPEKHGLILENWECSVSLGETLQTLNSDYKDYYPDSVFNKKPIDESLDMNLAVNTMLGLVGENTGKVATRFRAFFKGCKGTSKTVPHPSTLLKEFDEFLFSIYGKPKFHHFSMPQ